MNKRGIFLILSFLKLSLFQDKSTTLLLIEKAKEYRIDLTNPEDNFFHDICQNFGYIKKDITLEYRRKYYFFPKANNDYMNNKLINQRPIRNNTSDCFLINNSFSNLIKNLAFVIFLPIFIIQFSLLSIVILFYIYESIHNTPNKKRRYLSKKLNKNNLTTYNEFIPEINNNEVNTKLGPKNEINKIDMDSSSKKMETTNDNESNIFKPNEPFNINTNNQNDKNGKENEQKNNDEKKEELHLVEKSIENYTFGMNFGKGYKFSSNTSIK